MRLRALLVLLLTALACAALPPLAMADGDPGSDVLVAQNLFTGSLDVSVTQQVALAKLLSATASAGSPVRVAIIASSSDLGSVTPLWQKPQQYAEYLGTELEDTYTGRLLIVMPDGLGVYWHADPSGAGRLAVLLARLRPASTSPSAVVALTESAVYRVESAAGVSRSRLARLSRAPASAQGDTTTGPGSPASSSTATGPAGSATASGHSRSSHKDPDGLVLAGLILFALLYVGWRTGRLRTLAAALVRWRAAHRNREPGSRGRPRIKPVALLPTVLLLIVVAALIVNRSGSGGSSLTALERNPNLDPGTQLQPKLAPNFTLYDESGQRVSLSQYRGKAVILAFIDDECRTLCPLTTQSMLEAKRSLGSAGKDVQLLGVNANWKSKQIEDVQNYTQVHGLEGQWHFLTSPSLRVLEDVWKSYGVDEKALVANDATMIDHVAAVFVIDPRGYIRTLYTTQNSYASVPQFGQLMARDVSRLLPGHPKVSTDYSYAAVRGITPAQHTSLPRAGGGEVALGPGRAHLYVFFDTWDTQTLGLAADLDALNAYERAARGSRRLPQLTAIDEGSVEPSPAALPAFLRTLPRRLGYPVAIDQSGRVADGYGVQGEPWFVVTNSAGRIIWYQAVYTQGWPSAARLEREVRTALSTTPVSATTLAQARRDLAGSPPPLAALHRQASMLLPGGQQALDARIKRLEAAGYPIVLNIWASWCAPCVKEFPILAQASALYGRQVAFLGADNGDSTGDPVAFLREHHVSYPSYSTTDASIESILAGGLEGTPTTVFIEPNGQVSWIHPYSYASLGAFEADIEQYALYAR